MKITGVMVQYYVACKRELWFFINQINMNYEDDNILIGKYIHEESYKREKKNVIVDNTIAMDFIKKEGKITIFEIKKSSRLEEPVKYQLYYYLYYLKHNKKISAKGRLVYPKEKKTEDLLLNRKIEKEIENILKGINEIASLKAPPPPLKKPYCKRCSYYELCWV
jgi:CRISPR-associated exonuclease Cas4